MNCSASAPPKKRAAAKTPQGRHRPSTTTAIAMNPFPCRHVLREGPGVHQAQVRARQARHQSPEDRRQHPRAHDRNARRVRGLRRFPRRPQRQTPASAEEEPSEQRHHGVGEVRRDRLIEERRPEQRNPRQQRHLPRGHRLQLKRQSGRAETALEHRPREAQAADGHRRSRDDLVGAQPHREAGEYQRGQSAGERARQASPAYGPDRQRPQGPAKRPPDHRTLEPDIDHAGSFRHRFAEGRQRKRHRHSYCSDEEGREDGEVSHWTLPAPCPGRFGLR